MSNFYNFLQSHKLEDLGFQGYLFTWYDGSNLRDRVEERLDCFCATRQWCQVFPSTKVWHLFFLSSDHSPILLDSMFCQQIHPRHRLKRFERWWLEEHGVFSHVASFWNHNVANLGIQADTLSQLILSLHT